MDSQELKEQIRNQAGRADYLFQYPSLRPLSASISPSTISPSILLMNLERGALGNLLCVFFIHFGQ